jgi:hypothetical protein
MRFARFKPAAAGASSGDRAGEVGGDLRGRAGVGLCLAGTGVDAGSPRHLTSWFLRERGVCDEDTNNADDATENPD